LIGGDGDGLGFIANEDTRGGNNAACRGISARVSATATRERSSTTTTWQRANAADDGDLSARVRASSPTSGTRDNGRATASSWNRGACRGPPPAGGPAALRECGGPAECDEREDEDGRPEGAEGRVHE